MQLNVNSANQTAPLVAIVDDDSSVSAMLSRALRHAGLATVTYPSAELLLDALPALAVQCLVVDVDLPGMTGLALLRTLRERGNRVAVVVVSGALDDTAAGKAQALGASGVYAKPFDLPSFIRDVKRLVAAAGAN